MTKRTIAILVITLTLAVLVLGYEILSSTRIIHLRVSTTTSLYSTGLLEYLASKYVDEHPDVRVEFIPVGSGQALLLAARGDVCAVIVHAPNLEAIYVSKNIIDNQVIFAYNYFAIVGPASDPANVRGAKSAIEAFRAIYLAGEKGKALFVSRGDHSGTNERELALWRTGVVNPEGRSWYLETGQGMAETLIMANEKNAYTLTDMGTFLYLNSTGRVQHLRVLLTGDASLINIYSAYLVTSCKGREREAAESFLEFLFKNQDLIGSYRTSSIDAPLFMPANGVEDKLHKYWVELARGELP